MVDQDERNQVGHADQSPSREPPQGAATSTSRVLWVRFGPEPAQVRIRAEDHREFKPAIAPSVYCSGRPAQGPRGGGGLGVTGLPKREKRGPSCVLRVASVAGGVAVQCAPLTKTLLWRRKA